MPTTSFHKQNILDNVLFMLYTPMETSIFTFGFFKYRDFSLVFTLYILLFLLFRLPAHHLHNFKCCVLIKLG